jgi:hypothetical protein
MKAAIIGLGNIGSRVASNLVAGGDNVIAAECGETYGLRDSPAIFSRAGRAYDPAARIARAVSFPFTSAASTVPISRPAYNASPEKNMAPPLIFRSAACACRVLGVA